MSDLSDTVPYALVKRAGGLYGKRGEVWHQWCVSEFSNHTIRKWFSLGEISRSELADKECVYCKEGWRQHE